jgi:phage-related minor tail protein
MDCRVKPGNDAEMKEAIMADSTDLLSTSSTLDGLTLKTKDLTASATTFSRAMTQAFSASVTGGKQFDDVLKSLGLRISDLAVRLAFKPLEKSLTSGLSGLLSGLTGSIGGGAASASLAAASGAIKPFAAGGVIGTPSYFPLANGGVGLAGEVGPEAIMPLKRGPDGRLGVAGQGGGNSITIQIATPDLDSFRRSESYITGQIARAVARGQRSL